MKLHMATFGFCAFVASAFAATATNLASFEGIEEPEVKYLVVGKSFVPDSFVNITDAGSNTVRMTLRYHADDWWDGDRDRHDTSRQRAEVKGIGPHQKTGELFEYETIWRTSLNFFGTGRFCHVFQLKAVDGDNGAPLVTLSIKDGTNDCAVQFWSGSSRNSKTVRAFKWSPGVWENVRIRIKTSNTNDGEVLVSVNGDAFQGVTNVAVFRPEATAYRPKWGLYRGTSKDLPPGDSHVEHQNASARKM
jgi:hypothetical protein